MDRDLGDARDDADSWAYQPAKVPDLAGHLGDGVRGQAFAGGVAAFVAAYFAVRFLERYFERRTLTPFGIYCLIAGLASIAYLQFVK